MARNISKELAEQAGKTDVPLSTISSLLSLGRSETAVMYGLRKLENRLSSSASHLKPLDNKIAYLKACIDDADGRIHADNSPVPSDIAKEKEPEPIKEILSWEDTRRVEVKDEFLKLTTAEQKGYVLATAEQLKRKQDVEAAVSTPNRRRELAVGAAVNGFGRAVCTHEIRGRLDQQRHVRFR